MLGDLIALARENKPGEPLLQEVMREGHRIGTGPELVAIREHCRSRVAELLPRCSGSNRAKPPTLWRCQPASRRSLRNLIGVAKALEPEAHQSGTLALGASSVIPRQ